MTKEELILTVIDEVDDIIYAVSEENYKLLYMNRTAMQFLGIEKEEQWQEQPCYKVLCGRDVPCEQCPGAMILEKGQFFRERYIESRDCYLYQKYKRITIEGRKAKLGIATDVTPYRKAAEELKRKFQIESTLVQCIKTLYEQKDMETAINQLLSIIADYHQADRAYIFEFEHEGVIMHNTYEWCREGIERQIDFLKDVEISVIERWIEQFEKQGEFYITSLQGEVDKSSPEYEILQAQGIESLLAAPLRMEGKIVGFLGVDNPRANEDTLLLMRSVAAFVLNDIQRRKNVNKLYELSFKDHLTGVGNRYAYVRCMEKLENQKNSLGIVFADINGLKKINDAYGHKRGDEVICEVAGTLREKFGEQVFRVGGDEFVVFCIGMPKEEFEEQVEQLLRTWHLQITASVGKFWIPECTDVEAQVIHADLLMYQDKQNYYKGREE